MGDSYKGNDDDTSRADGMYGSGPFHSNEFRGGGAAPAPTIRPPPSMMRRRSSRANMLLAAHPVSDPILDITLGSAHGSSLDDDDGDDDVSTVVGDYDLVFHGNAGLISTIKSLLRGRKRIILLLLFFGTIAKQQQQQEKQRAGNRKSNRRVLGSAMIGSITDALSPILPFAGGVDLRRGEHWGLDDDYNISSAHWSEWFWPSPSHHFDAPARKSLLTTRSRLVKDEGNAGDKPTKPKRPRTIPAASRHPVIAAAEPFVTTDEIAKLTLEDIALVFRYTIHSSLDDFDKDGFIEEANVSERTAIIFSAMEKSVAKSRGNGIASAATTSSASNEFGEVDALMFCAAMRILAEWRVLRQVPDGYKGYAVGMSLGHKDVVQNLVKIEAAIHDLIELRKQDYQVAVNAMEDEWDRTSCQADNGAIEPTCEAVISDRPSHRSTPPTLQSPTLRELLQYEIEEGIQNVDKLPRLKEKSAAMGILWVRRQLMYQTEVFANVLLVPSQYETVTDAVAAAYSTVYDAFHGWAVQKIFNYSFQAAPDSDLIFRHMNPSRLKEVTDAALNGDIADADDDIKTLQTETTETQSTNDFIEEENVLVYDEELNQTPFYQLPFLNASAYVEDWAAAEAKAESTDHQDGQGDPDTDNPWIRFGLQIASEWDKIGKHVVLEWDKLGKHVVSEFDKLSIHVESEMDKIGQEWEKFASNVIGLFQGGDNKNNRVSGSIGKRKGALSGEALELYISRKMEQDAKSHISSYLEVVSPLLDDIAGLFEEMNCDDLTKV